MASLVRTLLGCRASGLSSRCVQQQSNNLHRHFSKLALKPSCTTTTTSTATSCVPLITRQTSLLSRIINTPNSGVRLFSTSSTCRNFLPVKTVSSAHNNNNNFNNNNVYRDTLVLSRRHRSLNKALMDDLKGKKVRTKRDKRRKRDAALKKKTGILTTPQRKGVVVKLLVRPPRRPNSAARKVCIFVCQKCCSLGNYLFTCYFLMNLSPCRCSSIIRYKRCG